MTEGVPQDPPSLKATDEHLGSDTTGTSEDHVVTKTVKPDDLTEIQFVIDWFAIPYSQIPHILYEANRSKLFRTITPWMRRLDLQEVVMRHRIAQHKPKTSPRLHSTLRPSYSDNTCEWTKAEITIVSEISA